MPVLSERGRLLSVVVRLPRPDSYQIGSMVHPARFLMEVWGRRAGKNTVGVDQAVLGRGSRLLGAEWPGLLDGAHIGWSNATEKNAEASWRAVKAAVAGLIVEKREDQHWFRLQGGGKFSLFSAYNPDSVRGAGLDGLICDEFALYPKEFWPATRPALSDRNGWAVCKTTPPTADQVRLEGPWLLKMIERAIREESAGSRLWGYLRRTSWQNPLITSVDLAEALDDLGEMVFAREYEAEVTYRTGAYFKPEQLAGRFDRDYRPPLVIQVVDTAAKTGVRNDWTVIATWGTDFDSFYLLDVWRRRVEFPELKVGLRAQADLWQPSRVLIEDKSTGISVIQELRRDFPFDIEAESGSDPPLARVEAVTPVFEAGKVRLREGCGWIGGWIQEHLDYPDGDHDDQVMTSAYGVRRLKRGLRVARGRAA